VAANGQDLQFVKGLNPLLKSTKESQLLAKFYEHLIMKKNWQEGKLEMHLTGSFGD
jgi:hypothetical protein